MKVLFTDLTIRRNKVNRFEIALGKTQEECDPLMLCLKEVDSIMRDNTPPKDLGIWLEMPEDSAIGSAHHGLGAYIRNEWRLWSGEGALVQYFNGMGIKHPDDMSGIILASYHQWKNGKPINLEKQVKYYVKYWKDAAKKDAANKRIQGDNSARRRHNGVGVTGIGW